MPDLVHAQNRKVSNVRMLTNEWDDYDCWGFQGISFVPHIARCIASNICSQDRETRAATSTLKMREKNQWEVPSLFKNYRILIELGRLNQDLCTGQLALALWLSSP